MVQGPSARSQSQVGARVSEYRGGGLLTGAGATSASESDSSEETRSAALSATRAYSSVSMLLQKWIAYLKYLLNNNNEITATELDNVATVEWFMR